MQFSAFFVPSALSAPSAFRFEKRNTEAAKSREGAERAGVSFGAGAQ